MESISSLTACDFEDLYNSIDFDNLKIKIMKFFNQFNSSYIGYEMFTDLFNSVVRENNLYGSKNVRKQIKGIPMELAAVRFWPIYLYIYEEDIAANEDI